MPPEREATRVTRFQDSVDKLTLTCNELRSAVQQLQITVALQGQQQTHFTETLKSLGDASKILTLLAHRLEECEVQIQQNSSRIKKLETDQSFVSGGRAIAAWIVVTSLAIGSIIGQVLRP